MSSDRRTMSANVAAAPSDGVATAGTARGSDRAQGERLSFPDADYPALYRAADQASRQAHTAHLRLVGAELALLIAAAVLGLVPSLLSGPSSGAVRVLPAVLLVAALIAKLASRLQRYDERWFDGRAVAETVKSSTWRYVMAARPYSEDVIDPEVHFGQALHEALGARPDLAAHLHRLPSGSRQVVTERMHQLRTASPDARRRVYLAARVEDQEAWYSGKSEASAHAATVWFWIGLVFEGMALAAAILVAISGSRVDLVGVLAAISAAATAWTQLGRHDELAKSYGLAAHELLVLHARLEQAASEEAYRQGVEETEAAISREHTMWMAKRG